jgi:RimJ/RimL family protein N-acetyltransferase
MFSFKENYILENKAVRLSPLKEEHLEGLFAEANDEEIWLFFTEQGYGRRNFEDYLAKALKKRTLEQEYPFVIFDRRTNAIAGMTRLYNIDNTLGNIKIGHTWIGKRFQGTGLNKNCKYLLFEFIFDHLEMKRIGFGASQENSRSIQAMKGVGCKQEGVLRSFMPSLDGQKRVDIVLMSILYEEWDTQIRTHLSEKIAS